MQVKLLGVLVEQANGIGLEQFVLLQASFLVTPRKAG